MAVSGCGGMEILQQPGPEDEEKGGLEGQQLQELDLEHFEDSGGASDSDEEDRDPQDVFDGWMLTLTKVQRKMLAVSLYESFRKRQKMSKLDAAQESASFTGQFFNSLDVYMYRCHITDIVVLFVRLQQKNSASVCEGVLLEQPQVQGDATREVREAARTPR